VNFVENDSVSLEQFLAATKSNEMLGLGQLLWFIERMESSSALEV
jgi:hypothetical protein